MDMHLPHRAIGIDLGGTNIKAGLFDMDTGACLRRETLPTRDGERQGPDPAWAGGVRVLVRQLEEFCGEDPLPVGISAPGLAARDGSAIHWMPGRMAGLEGFPWAEFLHRTVHVLNDAHAALLGEVWQGAAKGARDVVMLTLGTGVGGGAICDGRLLTGHLGRAGHLGHVTVNHQGAPDIVNTPGSLEDAMGNATVAERSQGRFVGTRALLEAVASGDAQALQVWEASVKALAAGMVSLINVFDPETFILGGGIAAGGWDFLYPLLRQHLEVWEWRPGGHGVKVVRAGLGEWAGAYGAAFQVAAAP